MAKAVLVGPIRKANQDQLLSEREPLDIPCLVEDMIHGAISFMKLLVEESMGIPEAFVRVAPIWFICRFGPEFPVRAARQRRNP
jgi:hypothetical protein